LAKARRKSTSESLAKAQDTIARENGYRDWKHVTVCLEATAAAKPEPVAMSASLSEFLAQQQASNPIEPETAQALASGLVFAMDIKDADNERPEGKPELRECDEAVSVLARDIWLSMLRHEREEGVQEDDDLAPQELVQEFIDYVGNYGFFRYSGPLEFKTLNDAFAGPLRDFFFPPTHVWLAGKFFDMADVPEVRVDGSVIYSTRSAASPAASGSIPAAAPAAARPGSDSSGFVIARLDVRKLQPSLYEYQVSHSGQEVFSDAGFPSIAEALRSAADVTGDIRAYEIAYAGLVAGTYVVEELAASADAVAQRAVDLSASLGRF
jgi:hypothetical protein